MQPHVERELGQADFDIQELRVFMMGGADNYQRKLRVYSALKTLDPKRTLLVRSS